MFLANTNTLHNAKHNDFKCLCMFASYKDRYVNMKGENVAKYMKYIGNTGIEAIK